MARPSTRGAADIRQIDPLLPLVWLANHLSQFGQGLRAGEIVTTGSCCGVRHVTLGADRVRVVRADSAPRS